MVSTNGVTAVRTNRAAPHMPILLGDIDHIDGDEGPLSPSAAFSK